MKQLTIYLNCEVEIREYKAIILEKKSEIDELNLLAAEVF